MPRQLTHLSSKLRYRNGRKSLVSNTVKIQNVPAAGFYPTVHIFITRGLTAVHVKVVDLTLKGIIGLMCPPTCLLVSRADYSCLDRLRELITRIGVGLNLLLQALLDPPLGILSFTFRIGV
jgi:hypothetical protein